MGAGAAGDPRMGMREGLARACGAQGRSADRCSQKCQPKSSSKEAAMRIEANLEHRVLVTAL
jgi:hypothetical protein